jgi:UDP-glucose 4-epimerase
MDCVVTGGAGFIGSNLVDALLDRGDRVAVIDNLSSGKLANLQNALARGAVLHQLDVRDAAGVDAVFASVRPQLVFHFAAQIDVRVSVTRPALDAETNIGGTIAVLRGALEHGARRVVNTSTGGGLYGDADLLPTPETYPIRPLAPYGQSKYAAEGYCELYTRLHGLSTVSLRYGNVYGPRQDPHGEAGVVAIFAGRLLARQACTIFGDGTQTRDFVFVDDVVDAFVRAATRGGGLVCNIGTGRESSVNHLLATMADVAGVEVTAVKAPLRQGELLRSSLDVERAAIQLGWRPWTELADGIGPVLEFVRARLA